MEETDENIGTWCDGYKNKAKNASTCCKFGGGTRKVKMRQPKKLWGGEKLIGTIRNDEAPTESGRDRSEKSSKAKKNKEQGEKKKEPRF